VQGDFLGKDNTKAKGGGKEAGNSVVATRKTQGPRMSEKGKEKRTIKVVLEKSAKAVGNEIPLDLGAARVTQNKTGKVFKSGGQAIFRGKKKKPS